MQMGDVKCMIQVELAAGAAEDTQAALAADPENDLAYHLLGRWHTEMAQVRQAMCWSCCCTDNVGCNTCSAYTMMLISAACSHAAAQLRGACADQDGVRSDTWSGQPCGGHQPHAAPLTFTAPMHAKATVL